MTALYLLEEYIFFYLTSVSFFLTINRVLYMTLYVFNIHCTLTATEPLFSRSGERDRVGHLFIS